MIIKTNTGDSIKRSKNENMKSKKGLKKILYISTKQIRNFKISDLCFYLNINFTVVSLIINYQYHPT